MTETLRIDLHLHTTCSDGVLDPDELFAEVRRADLALFSVTDHDSMAAYPMPADLNRRSICGLEVDSELNGRTVHLLAYGVDPSSPLLITLKQQRANRLSRMESTVALLRRLGYPVEMQDVLLQAGSAASLGRPHLARALVARGIVSDVREAFDRFLDDGGIAFIPLTRLSAASIVKLIHESDGLAIVAHPKRLRSPGDLVELVLAGVDGVEIAHPTATIDDVKALVDFTRERGLLTTGGTDFHSPAADGDVHLGVDFDRREVSRFAMALPGTSLLT